LTLPPTFLKFALFLVGAYLVGSIPSAYIVTRLKTGKDIRRLGSGNVGSANVLSSTSSKALALLVILFDGGKGAFAVWLGRLAGLSVGMQMAVGLAAIAGHNWPIYLGFKGGRGIITSLGVIAITSPLLGLIVLVAAYVWAPFKKLALGVFLALLALPFLSWFLSKPLGITSEARLPATLGFIALTALAYFRRLALRRSELGRNLPAAELIVNRLFLDRDIRDREAWVNRNLSQG
jgi:acyl phosphate:glycerol-3-phosphate acyltransferase